MTASLRNTLFLALAAMLAPPAAIAAGGPFDSASLEIGAGPKVHLARVALQSEWEQRWFQGNGRHIGGYWDLSLAQWRGNAHQNVPGRHQNLNDFGITPVLRLQSDTRQGWYVEGGIGVHVLSRLYDNNADYLSTRFQFGDHLGAGYVFANGWEAGLQLQHFSNGGIKRPNSGVNFLVFKAARSF
jgi:lipid A 3-O-deacylase